MYLRYRQILLCLQFKSIFLLDVLYLEVAIPQSGFAQSRRIPHHCLVIVRVAGSRGVCGTVCCKQNSITATLRPSLLPPLSHACDDSTVDT